MNQKKRKLGKCAAVLLSAVLLLMSACGGTNEKGSGAQGKGENVSEELVPEYVYAADYIPLEEEQSYYNSQIVGGNLYNITYTSDETGDRVFLAKTEIQDGKMGETEEILSFDQESSPDDYYIADNGEIFLVVSRYPRNFYDVVTEGGSEDGEVSEDAGSEDGVSGDDVSGEGAEDSEPGDDVSGEGGEVFLPEEETPAESYDGSEDTTKYFLRRYSADGELLYETDLKDLAEEQDYFYVRNIAADGQGRVYLCLEDGIVLYDENGAQKGKIELGNGISWVDSMGAGKDGKIYICYYKSSENSSGYALTELDFENKKLGATYENFRGGNNGALRRGTDKDFVVYDQDGLYEYSLADQTMEKVLSWLDCDIDGSNVGTAAMDQDGKIIVLTRDWTAGSQQEIALLHKVKSEEVAQRETIVLGMLGSDSSVNSRVVEFNKTNDKYRITVKTYMDSYSWSETTYQDAITNFTNDLTSDNGPDILDISSLNLDLANYVRKGVIEDLTPYLEKSTVLDRSDFFERILEGATYDGTLAFIPSTFTLNTLAAKSSEVGDQPGWTLADLIAYSEAHPDAQLMEYANRESILQMMLMLNQNEYLDLSTGECRFDSPEFKELLTFANSFPEDFSMEDGRPTPLKIADGSLLLADASIYDFQEIQVVQAYFNEDVTFIGYPTKGDNNGCLMHPGDGYVINAKSGHKDGAWAFLESVLAKDITEDWSRFGFPSRKSLFEKLKEEVTKVEYVLDENGDPLLDENGEPIEQGSGGGMTWGSDDGENWSYTYHTTTPEEAAVVEELLQNAAFFSYSIDDELMKIISEGADAYFKGDKSVDEAVDVIQNRASLYVKENM